ncbi:MAG: hypothetical protein K0A89_05465 [ANME-2 cluster archaeon]|nr:hypothetical protein [ANME-2 cluster archaeon]
MTFHHDIRDEKAMVSIDFLTGVGVLLMTFLFASYTISSVMTPYSGYSKELYPAADRAATLLVRDAGYWTDGTDYGTEWNTVWDINQSYVKKIGLKKDDGNNTIDSRKLNVFMETHTGIENHVSWWEYPTSSTDPAERDNASRALGLGRNNFYIQIRPVNGSRINASMADIAALDALGEQSDVVAVTRLAMVEHNTFGQFRGDDFFGHKSPVKNLFVIEPKDFDIISNGIRFSIRDWNFDGTNQSDFKEIKMGDEINAKYNLKGADKLSQEEYAKFKNGINVSNMGSFTFHENDTLEFYIPVTTLDMLLPDRYTSGRSIYIQLNVESVVTIRDDGLTYFSSTKQTTIYPVKMTLWTW